MLDSLQSDNKPFWSIVKPVSRRIFITRAKDLGATAKTVQSLAGTYSKRVQGMGNPAERELTGIFNSISDKANGDADWADGFIRAAGR